jgi:hypothetical protein
MTDILTNLTAGDIITVEFDGGSRTVEVQSVTGGYVFTTSGKVRPGNIGGGVIRIEAGTFQPTMAQAPKAISAVRRAVIRFGRAA